MSINLKKGSKNYSESVSSKLGIPEERNEFLVDIIIATIQKMDENGIEVNRSTAIQECAKAFETQLPGPMTMEECLYVGHMIQVKGQHFAEMKASLEAEKEMEELQKLAETDPTKAMALLLEKMMGDHLSTSDNDDDEDDNKDLTDDDLTASEEDETTAEVKE